MNPEDAEIRRLLESGAAREANEKVVGVYRDSELSHSHPLLDTLAGLHRQPGVGRIELSGLDDTGVVALESVWCSDAERFAWDDGLRPSDRWRSKVRQC